MRFLIRQPRDLSDAKVTYTMANVISGSLTKTEAQWADDVKRLLRAEMARHGVSYEDLAKRLAAIGVHDTAVNLRNKVARGRFSATFLVQCLTAIGARALRLSENVNGQ